MGTPFECSASIPLEQCRLLFERSHFLDSVPLHGPRAQPTYSAAASAQLVESAAVLVLASEERPWAGSCAAEE
jgi:hypothetical protein